MVDPARQLPPAPAGIVALLEWAATHKSEESKADYWYYSPADFIRACNSILLDVDRERAREILVVELTDDPEKQAKLALYDIAVLHNGFEKSSDTFEEFVSNLATALRSAFEAFVQDLRIAAQMMADSMSAVRELLEQLSDFCLLTPDSRKAVIDSRHHDPAEAWRKHRVRLNALAAKNVRLMPYTGRYPILRA